MRRTKQAQLELTFKRWGGDRAGAGRPRHSTETVPHAARPRHSRHHPVLITLRVCPGVPSLRKARVFRRLRRSFAVARERLDCRLTNYAVLHNHIHLIMEAADERALSLGLLGLTVRLARGVNRAVGRRGRVFAERYHARRLTSPRQVRRALVYVLFNERHHLAQKGLSLPSWWLDPRSSAAEFDGFFVHPELPEPKLTGYETTVPPRSYLLRTAWRRHGLIGIEEEPSRR